MPIVPIDEERIKELIKAALIEVLQERRDLLYDAMEEALLDIGLVQAIEEGETSRQVCREEVFRLLNTEQ